MVASFYTPAMFHVYKSPVKPEIEYSCFIWAGNHFRVFIEISSSYGALWVLLPLYSYYPTDEMSQDSRYSQNIAISAYLCLSS